MAPPGRRPTIRGVRDTHLCLVNSLRAWGGAELWFLDTAVGLRERGHRVSLVAQPDSALRRRALAAGVPVRAIPIRCAPA